MSDRKNIIICGQGGFARECFVWVNDCSIESGDEIIFKGFLGPNNDELDQYDLADFYLGLECDYEFQSDDYVLICVGDIELRRNIVESLNSRNVNFYTLVHPTSIIGYSVCLGAGVIIAPYSILSTSIVVGDFTVVNFGSTIAHDVTIGEFNTFGPNTEINGNVTVGSNNYFGGRVSLTPKTIVADHCKISAGSVVHGSINDRSFLQGNPARNIGSFLNCVGNP